MNVRELKKALANLDDLCPVRVGFHPDNSTLDIETVNVTVKPIWMEEVVIWVKTGDFDG